MQAIHTDNAPAAIGPYSQAIEVNGFVFASGQIPLDPKTGTFVEGGIKEQTRQALTNASSILKAAGNRPCPRSENHCLSRQHGRFRRHERSVCRVFLASIPGPFGRGREEVAQRRARGSGGAGRQITCRNRGYRT